MPAAVSPSRWNFKYLAIALFIGFCLQFLFLPCLCDSDEAKMALAFSFDGLVLVRILLAYFRRETGKGWIFYAVLCYTSVLWIEGITYLVLGNA